MFFPENVNEKFVSESLEAEIYRTRMGFVKENVHDPCGQKGQPSDGDHHPDLILRQLMGKAVDINKPHVIGHTLKGCYCQPASKNVFKPAKKNSIPQIERSHYQEVNGLLDHSRLVSDFLPSLGFFIILREYLLKIKTVIGEHTAQ